MAKLLNEFDYAAVHAEAQKLMNDRKHLKRSAVEKYIKIFDEKCALSKEEAAKAKTVIPGGIQHNLANNHPFPISIDRAEGPYLYDIDGNRYIDFLCAGGPTIIGNNYSPVRDAIIEHVRDKSPITGMYHNYERTIAEMILKYYPSCEMFRALGSGTEADLVAIRLARAYTGRKHIIRISGGYHGWSDQLVYSNNGSDELHHGVPAECFRNTHAVPINDVDALTDKINELKDQGGVAAFIVEAIGQDSGAVPTTVEYHKAAERICRENGVLLIYDEVVTAFRLGMTGAQGIFGTRPDMTVFGKIIGGGLGNCGGLGGRKEIMSMLSAGIDKDYNNKVKVGGTLSANPLTSIAGIRTIEELEKLHVHEKLEKASRYFMEGIAEITEKYDVPALLFNHQSILHIDVGGFQHVPYCFAKGDPQIAKQTYEGFVAAIEFSMALAAEGLIISAGGKTYLPYQAIDIVDDALAIYDKVFSQFE